MLQPRTFMHGVVVFSPFERLVAFELTAEGTMLAKVGHPIRRSAHCFASVKDTVNLCSNRVRRGTSTPQPIELLLLWTNGS